MTEKLSMGGKLKLSKGMVFVALYGIGDFMNIPTPTMNYPNPVQLSNRTKKINVGTFLREGRADEIVYK